MNLFNEFRSIVESVSYEIADRVYQIKFAILLDTKF